MSGPILLVLRLLLTVSLYAFLGWAFLALWKEIRQQAYLIASRKIPTIQLTIKSNDRGSHTVHFSQPEILIGRDPISDIRADDETLSARHARLSYHHMQWWLEDLESTNSTLLNNEKLYTPTIVVSGDKVECGKLSLTIGLATESLNPPTQKIPTQQDELD